MSSANLTRFLALKAAAAANMLSPTEMTELLSLVAWLDETAPAFAGAPTFTGAATFTGGIGAAGTMGLCMRDFRKDGAWQTIVDAAPGSSLLGLAATTAGVNLVGNAANNNTKSDYAQIECVLPGWYKAGGPITVRLRAKWSTTLLTVSSKVDVDSCKVAADGVLGSDLCTTAAQQVTISFAEYSFVVTPTGRVPGDKLVIRVALLGDDTGGAVNTAGAISAAALVLATA